jgi:protease-4
MKKACKLAALALLILAALGVISGYLSRKLPIGDKIALINVEGAILTSKDTIDELKEYAEDDSVKAIVMRVDSPGGAVVPSQEIYEEVKKAAARKKVVVSMGSVAASGGYYISAPASRIMANPATITGSIGVIMEIPNFKGLMEKLGVKSEVITSGKHKDMASVFRGIGDGEREILQNVMNDIHEQFIKDVADGRHMPLEKVRELADARIFTGRQAREVGLVDAIGNLQDAIDEAAKLANIKGKPSIVTRQKEFSVLDYISNGISKKIAGASISLTGALTDALTDGYPRVRAIAK